ncbi:MAG: hypothetical protein AAFN94_10085 [Pseudomonadota bacterium]
MKIGPGLKGAFVGCLWGGLLAFWGILSFHALSAADPSDFARHGALLVASAVLLYGISRNTISLLNEFSDSSLRDKVDAIASGADVRVLLPGSTDQELSKADEEEIRKKVSSISARMPKIERLLRWMIPSEIVFVVLGTLQWGYGDLFHCWANDQGWQKCY